MNRSIKKITLFFLGIGILAFSVQGAYAQALDFFSNTQSLDLRSSGSDGAPGFNPCAGGTVVNSTTCTGAPGGSEPLLDPLNLGNGTTTAGLFEKTGPGAVTDNMFGIVERPASPLTCGAQGAGVLAGGVGSLNCGDGKFDPSTQDQTIPTSGTNLTGAMAVNTPIDMTSCGAGTTMGACANNASLHRSQVEDAFVWNPTGSTVNLPVNTANMPTIIAAPAAKTCAAGSAANPAVCGQASMIETTALGTTTTVVVSLATDWATTNSAAGVMGTAPTVNWESKIVQSEMIGGGTFDQTLSGSFLYNGGSFTATAYPNGESFTIRAGGGGSPDEAIP
ncbi:MAG: hypothetical protein LLH30_16415 [Candidatus Manganitrophus sp. SA1]|nr:hypothetical protein [Candidatus Manganitrophus morganii]